MASGEAMETEDERQRRGSVTGASKRRRDDEDGVNDGTYVQIRSELEEFLFNDSNKINKLSAKNILGFFSRLEQENINLRVRVAKLEGQLLERRLETRETARAKTFADVAAAPRPKIGKKEVVPKSIEKTVLVYPTDETKEDSDEVKRSIKEIIKPKEDGWQIRAMRKVRKGGVAVEAGSVKTITKIKEVVSTKPNIKCVEPSRRQPMVQIYDVDNDLTEEELKKCLYKQNLEDAGISEKQVRDEVKFRFKTGRRSEDICNWVVECPPKIRDELISRQRIYIDFASCRVADYLAVARCYMCQEYGHTQRFCTGKGKQICSHCGQEGHAFRDCEKREQAPVCVVCKAAKKPANHRCGTRECPIYLRALMRKVAMTNY